MSSSKPLILLAHDEAALRLRMLQQAMRESRLEAILVTDNANLYRLTGRVFAGWAYIRADGASLWAVKRPLGLDGEGVAYVRKQEEIPAALAAHGIAMPSENIGLELSIVSYSDALRLAAVFAPAPMADASPVLAITASIKTPEQQRMMEESGKLQTRVYSRIPSLFSPGMTDIELQIEAERVARLEGCLGIFRTSGQSMEIFMGNVTVGDNADEPTPYDFAMGGAGPDPSIPVGAAGEEIRPGHTVMVDLNGNFTGYMTDMTRVFSVGEISPLALKAHRCSIDICRQFERTAMTGASCADLYHQAAALAAERGLEHYFMGHRQHSGFVGHGVGVEINELPVIAPRSRHIIAAGQAIALEPKFVIPGTGAVGIENTYIITTEGARCITLAPEEILPLD